MNTNTIGKFDNVRLHVEQIPLGQLLEGYRKTKKHSARQTKKLADAIERVGFNVPILTDDALNIVSGHARLDAAKLLGLTTVPAIRLSHLTPEQLRLFKVFDNKIATEGELDLDAIRLELDDLLAEFPEVDLTDSGFEFGEIDAWHGLARTNELDGLDHAWPVEAPVLWQRSRMARCRDDIVAPDELGGDRADDDVDGEGVRER